MYVALRDSDGEGTCRVARVNFPSPAHERHLLSTRSPRSRKKEEVQQLDAPLDAPPEPSPMRRGRPAPHRQKSMSTRPFPR